MFEPLASLRASGTSPEAVYPAITLNIQNEVARVQSRLVDVVQDEHTVSIRRDERRDARDGWMARACVRARKRVPRGREYQRKAT